MHNYQIKIIEKNCIHSIIPLLRFINNKTPDALLKQRLADMCNQNYECAGIFDQQKLIGICGIWYSTRHYIGKSAEVDHVVIAENYRNKGVGKIFFNWIYNYLVDKGCEATELNTYVNNTKSHKFYYNEGYNIYGFHMLKVLRKDKAFY